MQVDLLQTLVREIAVIHQVGVTHILLVAETIRQEVLLAQTAVILQAVVAHALLAVAVILQGVAALREAALAEEEVALLEAVQVAEVEGKTYKINQL